MTWIWVFPFRCGQCQTRFYRLHLADPRRWRKADVVSVTDRERPPRWEMLSPVRAVLDDGGKKISLEGQLENASLGGTRLLLPRLLPEESQVEITWGRVTIKGQVRWHEDSSAPPFVHGIQFDLPLSQHAPPARPLLKLRLIRLTRRVLISLISLLLIAAATYGLVALMGSFQGYSPNYYEPKDIERQDFLQRILNSIKR